AGAIGVRHRPRVLGWAVGRHDADAGADRGRSHAAATTGARYSCTAGRRRRGRGDAGTERIDAAAVPVHRRAHLARARAALAPPGPRAGMVRHGASGRGAAAGGGAAPPVGRPGRRAGGSGSPSKAVRPPPAAPSPKTGWLKGPPKPVTNPPGDTAFFEGPATA